MNVASVGRSAGCLKAALRRTRFQRVSQRSIATTPKLAVDVPATPSLDRPGALSKNHRTSHLRNATMIELTNNLLRE